jgi:hypothetical protein
VGAASRTLGVIERIVAGCQINKNPKQERAFKVVLPLSFRAANRVSASDESPPLFLFLQVA